MRATGPVFRFFGWMREDAFHQLQIEVQEKAPVENQGTAFATLGVAAEFFSADRQVGAALDLNFASEQLRHGGAMAFHHEPIGCRDARGFFSDWKRKIVVETTRPLQDRAAAGRT